MTRDEFFRSRLKVTKCPDGRAKGITPMVRERRRRAVRSAHGVNRTQRMVGPLETVEASKHWDTLARLK